MRRLRLLPHTCLRTRVLCLQMEKTLLLLLKRKFLLSGAKLLLLLLLLPGVLLSRVLVDLCCQSSIISTPLTRDFESFGQVYRSIVF